GVLALAQVALDDGSGDAADRPGLARQAEPAAAPDVVPRPLDRLLGVVEVEAHEPVQLVGEVLVGGPPLVGVEEALDDDAEGRVGGGPLLEQAGLLAQAQELLFGVEFGVGVPGAADEDAVAVAEVGPPGAVGVPRLGWTGHG